MKRLTITRDDWIFNVVNAEDAAIRRRTRLPVYTGLAVMDGTTPIDAHYGARYIALNHAQAALHIQQNEREDRP